MSRSSLPQPFADMAGRVFVVTGGRSGIGEAVVTQLAELGARVGSLDVSQPLEGGPEGVLQRVCDVTDPVEVEAALADVVARFGGLDGVVQCAGITGDSVIWKMSAETWENVLKVNLTGAFYVLKAAVAHLRARGHGAVVNVTSINGMRGKFGQANYAASKGGVIALTKTAARELGRYDIRVNAVAPGLVKTPMTADLPEAMVQKAVDEAALKRVTESEDVAGAVLFLLSDMARQITGETLRVDAGQYM